jgi:hypothetical protein
VPGLRALFPSALVITAAACSHDWDAYAPSSGATTSASTGSGGAPSSSASTGGGGNPVASGGAGGSGASVSASTGGSPSWYDPALGRRRAITIGAIEDTALEDFPVLVRLDPTRIDYAATADGGTDLRFVGDDQSTLLAHDIEAWSTGGDSVIWVRVPALGTAGSTTIWLYHGGEPTEPSLPSTDTWSNDFEAVWHLGQGAADATAHGHDGTASGGVAAAAGKIGSAHAFDGTDDYVSIPASKPIDDLFVSGATLSAWIRPTSSGISQRGRIFDRTLDATFAGGWAFLLSDYSVTDSLGFAHGQAMDFSWWTTPASSIAYATWQHVAVTFAQADIAPAIYIGGVAQPVVLSDAGMGALATPTSIPSRIGNRNGGTDRAFAGTIDELRVASTVRSPAWIATEVRAVEDTLLTVGAEEQR